MQVKTNEWVNKSKACELLNISMNKLNNVIREHQLETRHNPKNDRERLVSLTELRRILEPGEER
jgi:hypothetical protein